MRRRYLVDLELFRSIQLPYVLCIRFRVRFGSVVRVQIDVRIFREGASAPLNSAVASPLQL
jgi:hypothetical protein